MSLAFNTLTARHPHLQTLSPPDTLTSKHSHLQTLSLQILSPFCSQSTSFTAPKTLTKIPSFNTAFKKMSLYIIYFLYAVGIIFCILRVVERFTKPRPAIYNDPRNQQTRRNLHMQDLIIGIALGIWTISIGFTIAALKNTLRSTITFPVVWISSTTVVWLIKIQYLLCCQGIIPHYVPALELSVILIVQTYITSLLAYGMSVLASEAPLMTLELRTYYIWATGINSIFVDLQAVIVILKIIKNQSRGRATTLLLLLSPVTIHTITASLKVGFNVIAVPGVYTNLMLWSNIGKYALLLKHICLSTVVLKQGVEMTMVVVSANILTVRQLLCRCIKTEKSSAPLPAAPKPMRGLVQGFAT